MEKSPLGKLPAELRNNIFKLCLELDFYIIIALHDHRLPVWRGAEVWAALQITTLCRQVRQETTTMFYGLNHFLLQTNHLDKVISSHRYCCYYGFDGYDVQMRRLLLKFGHAVRHVQMLEIDMGIWEPEHDVSIVESCPLNREVQISAAFIHDQIKQYLGLCLVSLKCVVVSLKVMMNAADGGQWDIEIAISLDDFEAARHRIKIGLTSPARDLGGEYEGARKTLHELVDLLEARE